MTLTLRATKSAVEQFSMAARIIGLICATQHVTPFGLECSSREWRLVRPRWLAMALLRRHTSLSLDKIALLFNRHHTAVHHALRSVADHSKTDLKFNDDLERLSAAVTRARAALECGGKSDATPLSV